MAWPMASSGVWKLALEEERERLVPLLLSMLSCRRHWGLEFELFELLLLLLVELPVPLPLPLLGINDMGGYDM